MKKFFETFRKCLRQYDKLWHLIVGFGLTFIPGLWFNPWGIAFITLWIGGAKEMYDAFWGKSGEFNFWDWGFTILGALIAVGCIYLTYIV